MVFLFTIHGGCEVVIAAVILFGSVSGNPYNLCCADKCCREEPQETQLLDPDDSGEEYTDSLGDMTPPSAIGSVDSRRTRTNYTDPVSLDRSGPLA
jgi:hypothetical protein